MRLGSNAGSNIPGSTLKEVVAFAIHQFASESWHLVLHLSHLGVEAFPYVGKFGVYYAEVTQLDRNITLDTTVSHDFCIGHTCVSLHQKPLKDVRAYISIRSTAVANDFDYYKYRFRSRTTVLHDVSPKNERGSPNPP